MRHRCYFSDTQYIKLIKDFRHQFLNKGKDKKPEIIIDKNEHFQVLLARAPYTPDHLLIVPIRHLIYMHELSSDKLAAAMLLINKRMDILHQTYPDINLLLRDGKVNGNIGKSVDHLHFHLIPSITI